MVLFSRACRKSTTGFSHAPLETAFSLHRGNTAVSIACHNRMEFYLLESNFIRRFLPRERSGSTGPGETTVGYSYSGITLDRALAPMTLFIFHCRSEISAVRRIDAPKISMPRKKIIGAPGKGWIRFLVRFGSTRKRLSR